jgi:hypothetical protein
MSTGCLPDVNVWLALASRRHTHARRAAEWMERVTARVSFCRVTQAGLLRLLTNPAVMGAETLEARRAWRVYDEIASDSRVGFLPEPPGLEAEWRRVTEAGGSSANWTGSYLVAFARAANLRLVTFDASLARRETRAIVL